MPDARAKLFTHGGSQAVRLPKAFRFEGAEVRIRREGDRVILEPVGYDPQVFWARIDACRDDAAPIEPQTFAYLPAPRDAPAPGPDAPA
jgi:antitoxin VapB